MNPETRQYILLAIALILPLILFKLGRRRLLLGWVCITLFVQVFDTTIFTNLPAGRIVGLYYLPVVLLQFKKWAGVKPVKLWLINYGYLLILAIAFGFIWPWPDITMARPYSLTSPGKAIIYSIRLLSDFSLAIFIANQLKLPGSLTFLARALVIGATASALGGLLYFASGIDLYYLITGLGEKVLTLNRARGLSIEPRSLGLACAYGIMALLLGRAKLFKPWIILLLINLAGLMVTYSASSLVLLIVGVITASLFFSNRERAVVMLAIVFTLLLIFVAAVYFPGQFDAAVNTVQLRLDPDYKLSGMPPGSFGEEIAYRLDVFDASALLFLLDQPLYALIGTGPGLISLPASFHVPPGLYSFIWTPEIGINSPPIHGLLLEISNSGLPGLILWFVQVISCWAALRFAIRNIPNHEERAEWKLGYALFLVGAVFYLVQVSSSPVWSIFLAIGWTAYRAVQEERENVRPNLIGEEASAIA